MSSLTRRGSESPNTLRIDPNVSNDPRMLVRSPSGTTLPAPRLSPTIARNFDPNDVDARERQRQMDVDFAMQLHRARSESIAVVGSPQNEDDLRDGYEVQPVLQRRRSDEDRAFPMSLAEHEEMLMARGDYPRASDDLLAPEAEDLDPHHHHHHHNLDLDHDAARLGVDMGLVNDINMGMSSEPMLVHREASDMGLGIGGLPVYQPTQYKSTYDFACMEQFAAEEKVRLGLGSPAPARMGPLGSGSTGAELRRRLAQAANAIGSPSALAQTSVTVSPGDAADPSTGVADFGVAVPPPGPSTFAKKRHRKLSQSNSAPRRQGKLALFEGGATAPQPSLMPSTSHRITFGSDMYHTHSSHASSSPSGLHPQNGPTSAPLPGLAAGHDRPYRFSFYSNAAPHTIHARSLSELPAEGQTFEDLFVGKTVEAEPTPPSTRLSKSVPTTGMATPATMEDIGKSPPRDAATMKGQQSRTPAGSRRVMTEGDLDINTWWLDVTCPTDEEMRMLSKVFSIHPLTTEDILMEETREKIELFRNYYFVCFRSFDQDIYSPTHLEALNMYIIVFREGTLSFHFRGTPHPQSVRRRIKQLKDYINVTSDWISYALIDDITDAFGPLIQSIEYEVDSIDELVLILKETEQSDMLRRIGTCRKKVMGLLRLMGNKADVVKGLAKRCNEHWTVAPKSDIGLYLSDIQDHLITMTQNLNHYEKILSRSHSNYLAQISIEMTDANNQINDVLSKLTALGTVLIPMNLVTGLWGMNVHVPGQDITTGYTWFLSIIGALLGFAILGGILTYKLLRSS